uniref:Uncharacterized protein n=1 Tax=Anguilla anguilla TaxID=7936 RepID=A0A0E9XN17_ANGAN
MKDVLKSKAFSRFCVVHFHRIVRTLFVLA